jgi:LytS/YehU family sensor histidine kinase
VGLTHWLLADEIFRRKVATMRWEMLLGLWVYGLIAGVSYAIRAHRDADIQRRVAERASEVAAQAQLVALRAQLNPHFLFNLLHSLGTLARRDVQRLDEALERLGDLLRHALSPASSGCVPFADDLAFAENYLAIERLRLGDRLRVRVDVSPESLDVQVPFLTLQPLVENAVLHGIDALPGGGTLHIRAALQQGQLEIHVQDDGAGMRSTPTPRNGIGLGALRERLALTYDRFDLRSTANAEGGYLVRLSVPVT